MRFSGAHILMIVGTLVPTMSSASESHRLAYSKQLAVEVFAEKKGNIWCQKILQLRVVARDRFLFSEEPFRNLIRKLGVVIQQECPEADAAKISGIDAQTGSEAFRADVDRAGGWQIYPQAPSITVLPQSQGRAPSLPQPVAPIVSSDQKLADRGPRISENIYPSGREVVQSSRPRSSNAENKAVLRSTNGFWDSVVPKEHQGTTTASAVVLIFMIFLSIVFIVRQKVTTAVSVFSFVLRLLGRGSAGIPLHKDNRKAKSVTVDSRFDVGEMNLDIGKAREQAERSHASERKEGQEYLIHNGDGSEYQQNRLDSDESHRPSPTDTNRVSFNVMAAQLKPGVIPSTATERSQIFVAKILQNVLPDGGPDGSPPSVDVPKSEIQYLVISDKSEMERDMKVQWKIDELTESKTGFLGGAKSSRTFALWMKVELDPEDQEIRRRFDVVWESQREIVDSQWEYFGDEIEVRIEKKRKELFGADRSIAPIEIFQNGFEYKFDRMQSADSFVNHRLKTLRDFKDQIELVRRAAARLGVPQELVIEAE